MRYFEEDAQLRDILITGGDALMSQNATLRNILDAVYKMAVRKRKANESRPKGRSTLSYNGSAWVLACLPTCLSESRTN